MSFDILFTEYQRFESVKEDGDTIFVKSYSEYIASVKPKPTKIYRNYCLKCIGIQSHNSIKMERDITQEHDFLKGGVLIEFSIEKVRHSIICKRIKIESIEEYCIDDNGKKSTVEELIRENIKSRDDIGENSSS